MDETKTCIKCGLDKPLSEFKEYDKENHKFYNRCNSCLKQQHKEYDNATYERSKEYRKKRYLNTFEETRELKAEYDKQYNLKNHESKLVKIQEYRLNNPEKVKEGCKKWRDEHKDKIYPENTIYHRERYDSDPCFRLRRLMRNRIMQTFTNKRVTETTRELLGCDYEFLKEHLENQFRPEMTWKNHGEIWEIDHKIPIASFNLMDYEQQKQCFHYSNMQPLFKTTEIAKNLGYMSEIGNRDKSSTNV